MDQFASPLCYHQDQLDELCPDRELITPEHHTPNDYYGQASVLKRYAGLPESASLKTVLEHGLVLDERMWNYDRDQQLPWILASSPQRAAQLRRLCNKHVESVGWGFLYARELVQRDVEAYPESERKGTLIFPCHSTHTVTHKYDHEEYALRLLELPEEVQPISVCLYWRNYEFGQHEIYQKHGIPVYTAGHMFDRDFLLRSYDLCRRFKYAASNVFGTHYFQAIASGCRFFYVPSGEIECDVPDIKVEAVERGTPLGDFERAINNSSRKHWNAIDYGTQIAIADEILGVKAFRSPEQLANVLARAAWADRISPSRLTLGGIDFPALPTMMRRRMRFVGKIRRSIKKRLPWKKAA